MELRQTCQGMPNITGKLTGAEGERWSRHSPVALRGNQYCYHLGFCLLAPNLWGNCCLFIYSVTFSYGSFAKQAQIIMTE